MRLTKRGKKRLLILFLLMVVAVGGAAGFFLARSVYRDHIAQERLASGMAAFEDGDYGRAMSDLNYYYSRNNDDMDALIKIAAARARVVEVNNRHVASAIRLYERVLQAEPDNREAIEELAGLYFRLGRRIETELYAKRMLEFDSADTQALEMLIGTRRAEGDFAAAIGYAEQLCAAEPESFGYHAIVLRLMEEAGRPNAQIIERAAGWERASAEDADGRWQMLLAAAYQISGRYDDMLTALRAAADRGAKPDLLPSMLNMLDLTNQRTLTDEVLARATKEYERESWIHELTIRRHWEAARNDDALAALEFALKNVPDPDSSLIRWQALLAIANDDNETARAAVAALESGEFADDADERDADRAWARTINARLNVDTTGWEEALKQYEQSLAMLPSESVLHFLTGEAYIQIGEVDRAAGAYGRAVELEPMWIGAGIAYSNALLQLGRIPEAFEAAETLCRRTSPSIIQPWVNYLRAWIEMERSGRPIVQRGRPLLGSWDLVTAVQTAYEGSEQSPAFIPMLIDAHAAMGLRSRQQAIMQEALQRDDLDDAQWIELARIALRDGIGDPGAFLDRAESDGPTIATASLRADLLRQQDKIAEGLAVLEAAQPDADDVESMSRWQRVRAAYLAVTDDPRAIEALNALLEDETSADAVQSAFLVLGLEQAWNNEPLVNRAIEVLKSAVGAESDRVQTAIASRTLRFHEDDPQAVANSTLAMDDIVQRAPDSLSARILLSQLLMASPTPNPTEAIRHLRHAVDHFPRRYDLYPRLIALLQQVGDYTAASQYLQALGRSRGLDETMRRTELALLERQGNFEQAVSRLTGMIDASSSEVDQLTLASFHVRAGQYTQAESVVSKLLSQFGASPLTLQFVADFRAATGRFDEAFALLHNSDIDGGEPVRARLVGAFLHKQGYVEQAGEWLQKSVELSPASAEAWLLLAQHQLATGKQQEARQSAMKGLEREPDHAGLRLMVATTSLVADPAARQEAIKLFKELEGDNKALIDTIEAFGALVRADGTLETSDRTLRRVRELAATHPSFPPATRLAFIAHISAGRTSDALQIARTALDRFPTNPEPAQWLIELHMQARRLDDALTAARTWRNRSLENPFNADATIARLLLMREDPAAAVRTLQPYETRMTRDPEHYATAYSSWMQALLMTGAVDRAYPLVEAVTEKRDELFALWFESAQRADVAISARMLDRIQPLCIETDDNRLRLALAWADLGKRSGRTEHFDRAMRLVNEAGDTVTRSRLMQCEAMILEARGDYEEAASRYRQVLTIEPDNVIVLNNLAYMLTKQLDRSAEALTHSSKAVTLQPEIPELLDTHAVVLLGNGKTREASEVIQRALKLRPDDASFLMTLCRVELAGGNRDAARQALEAAELSISRTPYALQSVRQDARALRAEFEASVNAGR